jgi:hypothetical protein
MHFFFSQKSQQMKSLQVPQQGLLWKQLLIYRAFLHISLISHKNTPNYKSFFLSLKGPRKGAFLHVPPESGLLWKQMPVSRALLCISFRVPSRGTLPPGSPHRAPMERDVLFLEPSFIHLSKSLVNEPPSRFPNGAPMESDAHLQSLPLHILQRPQ